MQNFAMRFSYLLIAIMAVGFFIPSQTQAQDEESVYFSKRVEGPNGEYVDRSMSAISFTAYLNGEQDSILIETAPRWDGGNSNWDRTNSIAGIELQNFTHFSVGDTAYLRFTNKADGHQGVYSQAIESIPWSDPNPFTNLTLSDVNLPDRPSNVGVTADEENHHTVTWNAVDGVTYRVYRKNRNNTIFNGEQRNLYTLVASGVTAGSYTDTNTAENGEYAYIVYAVNSEGVWSAHSNIVAYDEGDRFAQNSAYVKRRVEDASGNLLDEPIEDIRVTAFVNNERDSVLTETAPRWTSNQSNWDRTNSIIGIEFQNFTHFSVGDTAYLRFTNLAINQTGTHVQKVDTLPWSDPDVFGRLTLQSQDLPDAPQNVSLTVNDNFERTISWDSKSGQSYHVYRRSRRDTIFNGETRNLYTRIATDVSAGTFTDSNTNPDKRFAYIVYAEDESGTWSVHSREVLRTKPITGLQVTATTARNVTLSWDAFDPVIDKLAGYNIYRRAEGENYGSVPLAYEGTDTSYTDTRLEPGKTYYYTIQARNYKMGEMGAADEIKVTTESSTDGYTTYTNLKTAFVIYANGPDNSGGDYQMTQKEIDNIKFLMQKVRQYYWRNTEMQLNLDIDFITFKQYLSLTDKSGASTGETGNHLEELRGIVNTQYDLVLRVTPSVGGFWSWGATNQLGLPGPERRTGFAHVRWPYRVIDGFDEGYPAFFPNIDYSQAGNNLIWTMTHESQHAIDGIYNHNDHPEMGHGDFPQLYATTRISNPDIGCCYPGFPDWYSKRFGKRFDFQSTMMRDFRPYKDLFSDWGDIYEVKDADGDGMPDRDPRVPLDEARFETSTSQPDTDGDGYSDKQEATDGIFHYSFSDPHNTDTDGDGTPDGKDEYPRYPLDTRIKMTGEGFLPAIDGNLDEWKDNPQTMVNDTVSKVERDRSFAPKFYMAYSSDSLYVAFDLPVHADPLIRFDFDGDGRWYGAGNTTMEFNVSNKSLSSLRTWVATEAARDLNEKINNKKDGVGNGMWDDTGEYISEFGGRIFSPSDINVEIQSTNPGHHIELAIPRNEEANLMLEKGHEIGFQIEYTDVFDDGNGAKTFDWWSYAYVNFTDLLAVDIPAEGESDRPHKFALQQNYPNPFNPTTTIRYSIAEAGDVQLKVYNLLGREVATLVDKNQSPGAYKVQFDASNLSSGVYFYRLKAGNKSKIHKMTLIK